MDPSAILVREFCISAITKVYKHPAQKQRHDHRPAKSKSHDKLQG